MANVLEKGTIIKSKSKSKRTNNHTTELIESLMEFKPKDNEYRKTKKLIETLKKEEIEEIEEIEEYATLITKKIVRIANDHDSLYPTLTIYNLNPNIHNDLNIIMSFYFKIFKYLNPYVIKYIQPANLNKLNLNFHLNSKKAQSLIKYSIAIYKSNIN